MGNHKARFFAASLAATVLVGFDARVADAKLTTPACLAQKRKAWGDLRKCEATDAVKTLKGKVIDPAKCRARFDAALAKIDGKATKAGIPCRFGDNGDFTITDYDTGLQWEQKSGSFGGLCLLNDIHCVNDAYTWADSHFFIGLLNGPVAGGPPAFAGFTDWRLPKLSELAFLVPSVAILESIWGPNAPEFYWSGTTGGVQAIFTNAIRLETNSITSTLLTTSNHVRAVRTAF